jgi:ubiquinone/menaquinone biosynthesis C-methylase UbiE
VYEENLDDSIYRYAFLKRRLITTRIVNAYADGKHLRILDAGCGPGIVLMNLAEDGHNVVGTDITEALVREASDRLSSLGSNGVKCCRADVEELPFKRCSFDVVVCLGVLQYLSGDHKSLSEISRVVRPGGFIIICIPNKLKINVLCDPRNIFRFLTLALYRFIYFARIKPTESGYGQPGPKDYMRKYSIWQLGRGFSRYGLQKTALFGVDYGPLTFWQRTFLPNSVSMRINVLLDLWSQKRCFSWIKAFSGQWVIVYQRKEDDISCHLM